MQQGPLETQLKCYFGLGAEHWGLICVVAEGRGMNIYTVVSQERLPHALSSLETLGAQDLSYGTE